MEPLKIHNIKFFNAVILKSSIFGFEDNPIRGRVKLVDKGA